MRAAEDEEERQQLALQRFAAKLFNARQARLFTRWVTYVEITLGEKALAWKVLKGMANAKLFSGFRNWKALMMFEREEERKALLIKRFANKIFNSRQARLVARWVQYVEMVRADKLLITRILKRLENAKVYRSRHIDSWPHQMPPNLWPTVT